MHQANWSMRLAFGGAVVAAATLAVTPAQAAPVDSGATPARDAGASTTALGAAPPRLLDQDVLLARARLTQTARLRAASWASFYVGLTGCTVAYALGYFAPGFFGVINNSPAPVTGTAGLTCIGALGISSALGAASVLEGRAGIRLFGNRRALSARWYVATSLFVLGALGSILAAYVDVSEFYIQPNTVDATDSSAVGAMFVALTHLLPLIGFGLATALFQADATSQLNELRADVANAASDPVSQVDARLGIFADRGAVGPSLTIRW